MNLDNDEISNFILHSKLETDDHNVPSLTILPSNQIRAFYNEHNGSVFYRKSKFPGNTEEWDDEIVLFKKSDRFSYCYTYPVVLSDEGNRIYVIVRRIGPTRDYDNWQFCWKYSDDNGETWSKEEVILRNKSGVKNPPYLKVSSNNKNRVDFLITNGHPKIGSDVSIFHMYFEEGKFYQTNGSIVKDTANFPIEISDIDKLYNAEQSHVRAWIWDVAHINGITYATYAKYPSENDHEYYYSYYSDSVWIEVPLLNSGASMINLRSNDRVSEAHYSGGVVLDHSNPKSVFLSRSAFGNFEIEKWKLKLKYQWEREVVTYQSGYDNIRPFIVENRNNDRSYLLWMAGEYRHYNSYKTSINYLKIE